MFLGATVVQEAGKIKQIIKNILVYRVAAVGVGKGAAASVVITVDQSKLELLLVYAIGI